MKKKHSIDWRGERRPIDWWRQCLRYAVFASQVGRPVSSGQRFRTLAFLTLFLSHKDENLDIDGRVGGGHEDIYSPGK